MTVFLMTIREEVKKMRLIDADALKQDLRNQQIESLIAHSEEKNVFDVINEQPTAYDVDAVVAELSENEDDISGLGDFGLHTEEAIDIVRKGGVE